MKFYEILVLYDILVAFAAFLGVYFLVRDLAGDLELFEILWNNEQHELPLPFIYDFCWDPGCDHAIYGMKFYEILVLYDIFMVFYIFVNDCF